MMRITLATVVVADYDEAIAFYVDKLGFVLVADSPLGAGKRWVVVAPPHTPGGLLLAVADGETQRSRVGDQTGGRVAFFLEVDDFAARHGAMERAGVRFLEPPRVEAYGTVAVFEDLYGNRWDLIESRSELQG